MTASASAKDDTTARVGLFSGIVIKRFCTVIWIYIGMQTVILYGSTVQNPDFVWGHATRDLLGGLGIGLVGLMIACLMAALMSTADALMLTTSSLLTNNVYRFIFPDKKDSHYLLVGRLFCGFYIVGGIVIAMYSEGVIEMFKFMALFNAIVAAAIWMGLLWRRANAKAAWCSMVITFLMILVLPMLIPLIPGLRYHEALLMQTEPILASSQYIATSADVNRRDSEINEWQKMNAIGKAIGAEPTALIQGDAFDDRYEIAAESIFWAKLIKDDEGRIRGDGFLNVELLALHALGVNLSDNTPSMNQTIAVSLKIIVPFGALFLVGLLSKPQEKRHLDVFYAKLRTPVSSDHEEDAERMRLTVKNPERFDQDKLFKNSNWEIRRWDWDDWRGVIYAFAAIFGIIGLLWAMLHIGA